MKNRKMVVVVMGMFLTSLVAILCNWMQPLIGIYSVFVGSISGLAGLYLAGNITQKHLLKSSDDSKIKNDITNES